MMSHFLWLYWKFQNRFQNPNPCRTRQIASRASSQSSRCVFAPDMITMGLDITVCHDVMTDADKNLREPKGHVTTTAHMEARCFSSWVNARSILQRIFPSDSSITSLIAAPHLAASPPSCEEVTSEGEDGRRRNEILLRDNEKGELGGKRKRARTGIRQALELKPRRIKVGRAKSIYMRREGKKMGERG